MLLPRATGSISVASGAVWPPAATQNESAPFGDLCRSEESEVDRRGNTVDEAGDPLRHRVPAMLLADGGEVVVADDLREPVDFAQLVVAEPMVGATARCHPEAVPRQQLDAVDGGQVEHQVAEHEPQPVLVKDPELLWVRLAGAAPQPRLRP